MPSLTLRALEAMGYFTVPVFLQIWMDLPDYEKIPYLMQSIKLKCEPLLVMKPVLYVSHSLCR